MNYKVIYKLSAGLTFVIGLSVSSVFSQSYTISPNDSFVSIAPFNDLKHYIIQQNNITNKKIELSWKQISIYIPNGWEAYLCDNGHCYTGFPVEGTMDSVFEGEYGLMSAAIDPQEIIGNAKIRYEVWDVEFPNKKDTLTWIISANGLSNFNDIILNRQLKIYPNPADQIISFNTPFNSKSQDKITDLLGHEIISGLGLSKLISIETKNFKPGTYFIFMLDDNLNLIRNKFFIYH